MTRSLIRNFPQERNASGNPFIKISVKRYVIEYANEPFAVLVSRGAL